MENLFGYWRDAPNDPFDIFFRDAPIMMHSIDRSGILLKVSRFWANRLGYTPDEMVGRKSIEFLTEKSRDYAVATVLPDFMENGKIHNIEYDFVDKAGAVVPVVMSAIAQHGEDGNFRRSLAIIFDNSETRAAKHALREAAAEAQAASSAKSRFLAAMSHEIRTPMNAILGFAQLLSRAELGEKSDLQVRGILNASNMLMQLLTNLLDLSRIEAGHMSLSKDVFSLHELIAFLGDHWHSPAQEKGLQLYVAMDRSVPNMVLSDQGRIRQVLTNFLSNAVKFTDQGRITLTVHQVTGTDEQAVLRFEVADTGPGLDEEQRGRLFVPFVQIDAGFAKQEGGWGLGLSICRQIAEVMAAEVGVGSVKGQGATFFFELAVDIPDEEQLMVTPIDATVESAKPEQSLRILVAEDNTLNQDMMRAMLEALGHAAEFVGDGFGAIHAMRERIYDVVLMDITMPGLDGIGATEQIRAFSDDRRNTPIIAVTANAGSDARARFLSLGMDEFLPKPVFMDDLARLLNRFAPTPDLA
ncbi:MAG: ATP-binding protein [Pseudomonadota bacterium]